MMTDTSTADAAPAADSLPAAQSPPSSDFNPPDGGGEARPSAGEPSLVSTGDQPEPAKETPAAETPAPEAAPPAVENANDAATPLADPAAAPLTLADLTLPESMSADTDGMTAFLGLVNNTELSAKDRAQGFVELHRAEMVKYTQVYEQHQAQVWEDVNREWRDELKADRELGGNRLNTSLSLVKGAVEQFLSPAEAQEFLWLADATGFGNNKAVIKLFHAMATKLNVFEDGIVATNPAPPPRQRGLGNRGWYGNNGSDGT